MAFEDKKQTDKPQNSLAGRILLAMPGMGDPRFERAVIYVCSHDDQGAMGLVVNNVMPDLTLDNLLKQLDIGKTVQESHQPVMEGGPVDQSRGFILHSADFSQADTVKLNESFSVTGTIDAMQAVARGEGPEKMLFMLGYAGWSAGQLDQEIQQNAWLVGDPDQDLIFVETPDKKWGSAIAKLGIDPAMLSSTAGHA